MIGIDTLLSILLGSKHPTEYLMEYIRAPPAILLTDSQKSLFVKEHREYAELATFSDIFEVYILVAV